MVTRSRASTNRDCHDDHRNGLLALSPRDRSVLVATMCSTDKFWDVISAQLGLLPSRTKRLKHFFLLSHCPKQKNTELAVSDDE